MQMGLGQTQLPALKLAFALHIELTTTLCAWRLAGSTEDTSRMFGVRVVTYHYGKLVGHPVLRASCAGSLGERFTQRIHGPVFSSLSFSLFLSCLGSCFPGVHTVWQTGQGQGREELHDFERKRRSGDLRCWSLELEVHRMQKKNEKLVSKVLKCRLPKMKKDLALVFCPTVLLYLSPKSFTLGRV
uniref:Uncharacterized protein n=1 Tax=Knipowitschia caucasica TaxID=637954 RepID=A0AAV2KZ13_KNICA